MLIIRTDDLVVCIVWLLSAVVSCVLLYRISFQEKGTVELDRFNILYAAIVSSFGPMGLLGVLLYKVEQYRARRTDRSSAVL